ncbi:MAG: glycosyltransferase family 4 protein [Calditrichia bacterium]
MSKPKLIFFIPADYYFYTHRLPVAKAALKEGFEVSVITKPGDFVEKIEKENIRLIPINFSRNSLNPFRESLTILKLWKIYRSEKPDIVHHVALKPILYGSIAAKLNFNKIKIVNAFAGGGWLFTSNSSLSKFLKRIINILKKIAIKNTFIIVQNYDDYNSLREQVSNSPIYAILGSGVDPEEYYFCPDPENEVVTVSLVSRMLWEKGVADFIDAIRILKRKGVKANFLLAGGTDEGNPSSIPISIINGWEKEGLIKYLGYVENIMTLYEKTNIICLPSYYGEGLPKSLIEAASSGKPIVTTDWIGCREIVKDGLNGILVPIKNAEKLADALEKLILNKKLRVEMGKKGRELVVNHFTTEIVVKNTLNVYHKCLSSN